MKTQPYFEEEPDSASGRLRSEIIPPNSPVELPEKESNRPGPPGKENNRMRPLPAKEGVEKFLRDCVRECFDEKVYKMDSSICLHLLFVRYLAGGRCGSGSLPFEPDHGCPTNQYKHRRSALVLNGQSFTTIFHTAVMQLMISFARGERGRSRTNE